MLSEFIITIDRVPTNNRDYTLGKKIAIKKEEIAQITYGDDKDYINILTQVGRIIDISEAFITLDISTEYCANILDIPVKRILDIVINRNPIW